MASFLVLVELGPDLAAPVTTFVVVTTATIAYWPLLLYSPASSPMANIGREGTRPGWAELCLMIRVF